MRTTLISAHRSLTTLRYCRHCFRLPLAAFHCGTAVWLRLQEEMAFEIDIVKSKVRADPLSRFLQRSACVLRGLSQLVNNLNREHFYTSFDFAADYMQSLFTVRGPKTCSGLEL